MEPSREQFKTLMSRLRLPVIGAPLFLVSGPELVIAQCRAGIVGSFPAMNARPLDQLDEWLGQITASLAEEDNAPFAVNLIVHKSNEHMQAHLDLCVKHRVPIVISSLGAVAAVNDAVHNYGGMVFHDVIHNQHAQKAIEAGADGLVAVCAGAGGHAGNQSPFALVQEIRAWFDGPLALAGAIANGRSVLAAQVLGADLAYMGTSFIAVEESMASAAYRTMVVSSTAADIIYTDKLSGVHANYLRPSFNNVGLDADDLENLEIRLGLGKLNSEAKAWRDIWGAGQGVGAVKSVTSTRTVVDQLLSEYEAAKRRMLMI